MYNNYACIIIHYSSFMKLLVINWMKETESKQVSQSAKQFTRNQADPPNQRNATVGS